MILTGAYLLRGPKQLGLNFEGLVMETITTLPTVDITVELRQGNVLYVWNENSPICRLDHVRTAAGRHSR